jgi:hypothetical protein
MKLSIFTVATPDLTPEQLAASAQKAGWQQTAELETDGSLRWKTDWMALQLGMVPWKQVLEDLGYSQEMLQQFADYMRELMQAARV